jgi:HPt (histidine-containing phosphotransfer) domain-containing protein
MALTDRELLAKTLQAEAGNQGIGGMLAVGSVIRNRMAQGGSLRDVILAPAQFSAWNKVTGAVGGEQGQNMAALTPSEDAYAAADAILSGNAPDVTGGATHYYNPSISSPAWGREKAGGDWTKIGAHIFGKAGDFRTGAAKMNGEQTQQSQGLLGGLLGGQGIGGALGLSEDFRDRLAMGIMAGSDPRQFAPLIQQRAASMQERKAEAKEQRQRNKSLEYLKRRADAGDVLAGQYYEAASTGVLPAGAGLAAYLEQMTKVDKVSEAESQISRLMETGVDRTTAIAIRDGRLKISRNPVTQRAELIDMATGNIIGQATEALAEEVGAEKAPKGDRFKDLPVSQAGGLVGWGANIANIVTDALGAGQQFPNVGEAQAAMNDLSKRTILMLDADFAGKPTNFTREIVADLTVKPSEISQGSAQSYQKTVNMISALEEAISGAKAAINNPTQYSPQKIKEAEGSVYKLQGLLDDYTSLKNAFESKGLASQGAAGGQPAVVQTDQDRALIGKYLTPNYYRDNMLPSPK